MPASCATSPARGFPLHKHDFAQVWYIIDGEFQMGEGKTYGPGTIVYMEDPHFENEMRTETGGTVLFVQYPAQRPAAARSRRADEPQGGLRDPAHSTSSVDVEEKGPPEGESGWAVDSPTMGKPAWQGEPVGKPDFGARPGRNEEMRPAGGWGLQYATVPQAVLGKPWRASHGPEPDGWHLESCLLVM